MINWREGKAGFVGAAKYFVKGFFRYHYSSQEVGGPGFGVPGVIDPNGQGVVAGMDTTGQGVLGTISEVFPISVILSSVGQGVLGSIDETGQGVLGEILCS